jgi:hypothetical protein
VLEAELRTGKSAPLTVTSASEHQQHDKSISGRLLRS